MIAAQALVQLDHLGVNLNGQQVLQDINMSLQPGEIVTLIGPNGAGKTTLIRAVLGLQKPDQGRVWRRPGLRIGYMPQKLHIDPTLPLRVDRFLTLTRHKPRQIDAAVELTGIRGLCHKPVQSISGGELQRVLLARTLLQQPDLLVLDEPAQGVDVNGQVELYRLIHRIRDDLNCAVLMVSHDLHLVMAATDRVFCLNHHICCSGLPEQVSNDPAYRALFGKTAAEALAVYHHHHDHHHDLDGTVVSDGNRGGCSHEHHDHGHDHSGHRHDHTPAAPASRETQP